MKQSVSKQDLEQVAEKAAESPRRRLNLNMHEDDEDVNYYYNVVYKDAYMQPHIHRNKHEYFHIDEGTMYLVEFDGEGNIINKVLMSAEKDLQYEAVRSYKVLKGTWHTIVIASERAIMFEVKSGPYDPSVKEMSTFAPAEDDEGAEEYLQTLRKQLNI
ncbi:MAG: WbuC family cupin fold metalloprotein [Candidatus Spechtbacterales bacterium]|nr:WbuC family cupin fold metalloprotein [Candidatus Spechtbacterales bacterium]